MLAAQSYALDEGDLDLVMALLAATPFGWAQVGPEMRVAAEPVLALPGAPQHPGYPMVLLLAGVEALRRGDLDLARRRWDEAIAAEAALPGRPFYPTSVAFLATAELGNLALAGGDWDTAAALLTAADKFRDASVHGFCDSGKPPADFALASAGHDSEATALAIEAVEEARSGGSPSLLVSSLCALAVASARSDPLGARAAVDEALELMATLEFENRLLLTWATAAATQIGDWALVVQVAGPAIRLEHWARELPTLGGVLLMTARALAPGDPESAAVIQSAGYSLVMPARSGGADGNSFNRETSRLITEALGEERLQSLRALGGSMDVDEVVAFAVGRIDASLRARNQLEATGAETTDNSHRVAHE